MERTEWVERFRDRLNELIEREGSSRAAFAARIGLDRSTLSQLLAPENARLPRAETIAAIARETQVSADWLLGLTQEGKPGAELVPGQMEVEPGGASPVDERLRRWHAEAIGSKIRYVPTTLPDLLKTEDTIDYEYRSYSSEMPEVRLRQAESSLAYSRLPETDMEACSSFQLVEEMARGEGIWRDYPKPKRLEQLHHARELVGELYPTFRWFLFDGRQRFSVPVTIFGPRRVAVYIGNMYFVFNSTEHIRIMTRHFDDLIRAAVVQPTDVTSFLDRLYTEVAEG
ncbi:helix-turn-helix domain-containing protein [Ferruginivarius sediminum]|uniref:XRE family transcriptional regulator n=1 Tax=Ferruginivarius sediminum TaxID=2661937 RepID=A0A369TEL9_9PROT|nr:helix-turn-helix transcriptional regulator [Ferruginivarius sediminum]RDD63708.1 XRE family transcriptional regulator [Ferruginivarius sediminum]